LRNAGSCWLHATLSSVQDRIKIKKRARGVDTMLARQVLLQVQYSAHVQRCDQKQLFSLSFFASSPNHSGHQLSVYLLRSHYPKFRLICTEVIVPSFL
jgi:hypothetical protein